MHVEANTSVAALKRALDALNDVPIGEFASAKLAQAKEAVHGLIETLTIVVCGICGQRQFNQYDVHVVFGGDYPFVGDLCFCGEARVRSH